MGLSSIWHWVIVLVIVLVVFGTKKLRNIGSDLGGAVKGFKEGVRDGQHSTDGDATQLPEPITSQKTTVIDVESKEKH